MRLAEGAGDVVPPRPPRTATGNGRAGVSDLVSSHALCDSLADEVGRGGYLARTWL